LPNVFALRGSHRSLCRAAGPSAGIVNAVLEAPALKRGISMTGEKI
jgi:hypothetical protein